MDRFFFGILLVITFSTSGIGQIVTDLPQNQPNTRFLDDPAVISVRPGLSIAGFSNDGGNGLSLQQILNEALESENSSAYESVSKILSKAKDPISLPPEVDQIEYTSNILQYRAFEALASLILEQNGVAFEESNNTYGLNIREHSEVIPELTNALNTLAANDKLVRKLPGGQPFDDYLNAIRSYNNMARTLDLYLAIENAYQHFGLDESPLFTEQEKTDLMARFRADINILFNDGLKREYDVGGLFSVTEDNLEAGNRPLKGYISLAYASMSAQTANQADQDVLDNYIATARRKASESSDDQRSRYWMYQTGNGNRFWAEGPFYLDFVLKDAIIFWHAIRINEELDESFDPFFNDWFLNPVRWLADLSTPDGSLPPLDDSNKRAIQSANLLRWSGNYGDENVGRAFTTIYEKLLDYHPDSFIEDQFFLIEMAIPINESGGADIESLTNPEEQQFIIRHTDASNQNHYISFTGEKGESITSGEGHEQPDQLQLLYYLDEYSFLTDGGYDRGSPKSNSTWNGYLYTNTMQYDASKIQTAFDFVTYQNEGGLESPFASIAEARKVSTHNEAGISYENSAQNVELFSGEVDLNLESPTESSSTYNRSILFVKGENSYLIDVNDILAHSGRNNFVMRYHGNSDKSDTENGWFFWGHSDQSFASPTHHLFLYTVPLVGNYSEEHETIYIQETENRIDGNEKYPYPVIRKSYISNEETERFVTASILNILDNAPASEPGFVSDPGNLSYFTYPVDSETTDLFVFAADSSENQRSLTIQSGPLSGIDFSLQANEVIGFSRLQMNNDTWIQDPDYSVHLQSSTAPNPPEHLMVSIEERSSGQAAVLTWDAPEGEVAFYEIWKQVRNRSDKSEQPATKLATSETNSFIDASIIDLPGDFEQRWFVKAVNSNSLVSAPSNYTQWIYVDPSAIPDEFKLFNPFPNPMQTDGNIRYQLAEESDITLKLFDMLGREIKLVVQDTKPAGTYIAEWGSHGIAAGVYILQLTATSNSDSTFQESVMVSVIK